jgi:hypothetical protein
MGAQVIRSFFQSLLQGSTILGLQYFQEQLILADLCILFLNFFVLKYQLSDDFDPELPI